jgi:hypothetical protein
VWFLDFRISRKFSCAWECSLIGRALVCHIKRYEFESRHSQKSIPISFIKHYMPQLDLINYTETTGFTIIIFFIGFYYFQNIKLFSHKKNIYFFIGIGQFILDYIYVLLKKKIIIIAELNFLLNENMAVFSAK